MHIPLHRSEYSQSTSVATSEMLDRQQPGAGAGAGAGSEPESSGFAM